MRDLSLLALPGEGTVRRWRSQLSNINPADEEEVANEADHDDVGTPHDDNFDDDNTVDEQQGHDEPGDGNESDDVAPVEGNLRSADIASDLSDVVYDLLQAETIGNDD